MIAETAVICINSIDSQYKRVDTHLHNLEVAEVTHIFFKAHLNYELRCLISINIIMFTASQWMFNILYVLPNSYNVRVCYFVKQPVLNLTVSAPE